MFYCIQKYFFFSFYVFKILPVENILIQTSHISSTHVGSGYHIGQCGRGRNTSTYYCLGKESGFGEGRIHKTF